MDSKDKKIERLTRENAMLKAKLKEKSRLLGIWADCYFEQKAKVAKLRRTLWARFFAWFRNNYC